MVALDELKAVMDCMLSAANAPGVILHGITPARLVSG
jgi:hypothetical protein